MKNLYDAIIVGGGPAGLTAALYLARAKYRVLVVEKEQFGGQINITDEVINYPGVFKTSGSELTEVMKKQAESFGAEFLLADTLGFDLDRDIKLVKTTSGEFNSFGVLIATGANPRMIGFEGEMEYKGRGVAYCATCDGEFFTNKEIFVVGGGFAAAEEAVFLTRYASHVTILIRKEDFSCAKSVADKAKNHEKITVLTNTEVIKVEGDSILNKIVYKNHKTGEIIEYKGKDNIGVFVFAGYAPATELFKDIILLDDKGYVITDSDMKTNIEGVFAAGDVCVKELRQVVTATADGAVAASGMEKYIANMQKKTGKIPEVNMQTRQTAADGNTVKKSKLFNEEAINQLNIVFSKMSDSLVLKLSLGDDELSRELKAYMEELASLTDKISLDYNGNNKDIPCVEIYRENGVYTGLAYHGVPGGHEFNSFVLSLYNGAGPGQEISEDIKQEIAGLKNINFKVIVSQSCTMCPELVTSVQKIAAENDGISAEIYDVYKFGALRSKYNIMSVPCMVVNDGEIVSFGKKNIRQVLDTIKSKINF